MSNLDNCVECGTLFVRTIRNICDQCNKKYDANFQKVYEFIRKRENRMANMQEVVKGTSVPETQIYRFIREGRLKLAQFPNLTYPCETCNAPIREGRICTSCKRAISQGINIIKQEDEFQERKNQQEKERNRQGAYHSLKDRLED